MSLNTYGHVFRVTTWGESHGPALGATVDGCPPGVALEASDIQVWLDKRKPGQNKFTTQRREADEVEILSGIFEGRTTGTPIQLMIRNTDQRSKDYGDIAEKFRPGHLHMSAQRGPWLCRLGRNGGGCEGWTEVQVRRGGERGEQVAERRPDRKRDKRMEGGM